LFICSFAETLLDVVSNDGEVVPGGEFAWKLVSLAEGGFVCVSILCSPDAILRSILGLVCGGGERLSAGTARVTRVFVWRLFVSFDAFEGVHDDLIAFGGDDLLDEQVIRDAVLVLLLDVGQ
jgi:hypothetical protein